MGLPRARKFVGLASLLAVTSCALISGVNKLETTDDALADGSVGASASSSGTSGSSSQEGGSVFPFDGSGLDGSGFFDGTFPDVELPDTGGPDSGPAGSGVVQCSGNLQCTNGQACCFSLFGGQPSCKPTAAECPAKNGLLCDDDADCTGGKICCIKQDIVSYAATSSCEGSCAFGTGFHACSKDEDCSGGGPGAGSNCRHVQLAPDPIKACQ